MRTAAACLVLAAAIATPGIVVAATHSTPHQHVTFASGSAPFHPVYLVSADPQLIPAVAAIRQALRARGEKGLQTIWGDGGAQILQTGGPENRCPVHVKVHIVKRNDLEMWIVIAGCPDATIQRGNLRVRYSPASLGGAIREALATLPR